MAEEQQQDPTSPVSPLAPYPPLPAPEHRSRAPEFYGFVAWTSTAFLYVVYLLWALLPDACIQRLGIAWYPSRHWAVLVPAYSVVVALLTYFVYFALALFGTPAFGDMCAVTGAADPRRNAYAAYADSSVVPELYDIPIGLVNRAAYGVKQDGE
ncbi:PIG-P-domain-containing protein [Mycena belliarum]|uniref:PIG-P-domain-containing protein n=1 Tax=Mycena belliarum TaxID=1033014 RepID=A0AAD6UFW8_9AGAR|nr:PIG-P-domain-containing protein [Mycena belliae]